MEPEFVASRVFEKVLEGTSGVLVVPERLGLLRLIRSWPAWMQVRLRNRGGRKVPVERLTMEDFVKDGAGKTGGEDLGEGEVRGVEGSGVIVQAGEGDS